jgi:hypothetical protein
MHDGGAAAEPRRPVYFVSQQIWAAIITQRNCSLLGARGRSRDISVVIAMAYGLDGWISIPGKGKIFLFSTVPRLALGPTHPTGYEAEHSPPSGVEARSTGVRPSSPYAFMALRLCLPGAYKWSSLFSPCQQQKFARECWFLRLRQSSGEEVRAIYSVGSVRKS